MATPWGRYSYTYDALNRVTGIVNPQGITVSFGYDAVGRRNKKTVFKNAPEFLAETAYTYDAAGQLLNITNKAGGKVVDFTSYEYDAVGNRVKKEDGDGTTKYRYDASNRLITAEPVPMNMAEAEVFIYDRNGNRRYDRGAWDYKYDAANRLLENSTYTYTHDLNGNLAGRAKKDDNSAISYAYNPEQQLSEVTTPEHKANYRYDPLGRRIEKAVDGTVQRYVYDNEDIIAILDGNNSPTETFTHGPGIDEPLIMTKIGGINYFYHADGLGSIKAITDDNNQTVETYNYKAYGEPTIKNAQEHIISSSIIGNTLMFAAREYDLESGLYNNRRRPLDPTRGTFIQEEPFGYDGPNLYHYALNNPLRFRDPDGLAATGEIIGAGIGGVLGGYYGGIAGLAGGMSAGTLILPGVGTITLGIAGIQGGQLVGAALGAAIGGVIGGSIEDLLIYSKGGRQNQGDSGLEGLPDSEIQRRARDATLTPSERRRYQKEEKARGLRNVRKRGGCS